MSNFILQKERWIWREENLEVTCVIPSCLTNKEIQKEQNLFWRKQNKTKQNKTPQDTSTPKCF